MHFLSAVSKTHHSAGREMATGDEDLAGTASVPNGADMRYMAAIQQAV